MAAQHGANDIRIPASGETSPDVPAGEPAGDVRWLYPPILTPTELAKIMRVDRRVIYRLLREGQIPGARPLGRQWRIDRDVVLRWLRDGQGRVSRSTTRK